MFPSGWGFYDLYRRGGLPVDGGPAKKAGKQHDWNDMEILAQGNRIRFVVNGKLVADLANPIPNSSRKDRLWPQVALQSERPRKCCSKGWS